MSVDAGDILTGADGMRYQVQSSAQGVAPNTNQYTLLVVTSPDFTPGYYMMTLDESQVGGLTHPQVQWFDSDPGPGWYAAAVRYS